MGKDAQFEEYVQQQVSKLAQSNDIRELREHLQDIEKRLAALGNSEVIAEYKKETAYQENDFSPIATTKSIRKARDRAVIFLEKLVSRLEHDSVGTCNEDKDVFTKEVAIQIIKRVLENFYLHIEAMYEAKVHGKAHITKEKLDAIRIGNEYDVQRMLYSILKPIFPEARLEVSDDAGYGAVRYDILIEKYNTVIEVKCSRPSMTEKSLGEELASDIYHYQYANVFFFVYDKDKIITNRQVFTANYSKSFGEKGVQTVVVQPVRL